MTPEERAANLVTMDEKDHCTMRIGTFALQFGKSDKMTKSQAAMLIERVRRSVAEEIADAIEEATTGASTGAAAEEIAEAIAETEDAEAAVEAPAPEDPVAPELTGAASISERVLAMEAQLDPDGKHSNLIAGSMAEAYRRGNDDMRAQAKAALASIFPQLDASMRIELGEVRKAIVERLDAMEVGQQSPRAAA